MVQQVEEQVVVEEEAHLLQHVVVCLSLLEVPGQREACAPTVLRRTKLHR